MTGSPDFAVSAVASAAAVIADGSADASSVPRIVVGVDGSDSSIDALREAVVVATALGGTIQAVGAWHHPATLEAYYPAGECSPEHDASEILASAAKAVFADDVPDWFSWTVRQGTPAHVLIDASKDARLLIVGSRGHGGVVGLLLGSVSAACAERAHCPVLIMHKARVATPTAKAAA